MKILLITLLLFITLGAKADWRLRQGFGFGRGRGSPWGFPHQQQNQININSEEIEWVCRNPKTNDIMIIASDNTPQQQPQYPGRDPWWRWQTQPPGHQNHHHQQPQYPDRDPWWQWQTQPPEHQNHHQQQGDNHWTLVTEDPPREETHRNQLPKTSEIPNNNHQPEITPQYHGGEGLIDIRIGE